MTKDGFFENPKPLPYVEYVLEREAAHQRRRDGLRPPWSGDPCIATRKLGNVFRDQDRVSLEFRSYVMSLPTRKRLGAVLAFRWFNYLPAFQELVAQDALSSAGSIERASRQISASGSKVFNTAYRIGTREGLWSIGGVSNAVSSLIGEDIKRRSTIEETWLELVAVSGTNSGFICYQIALDLRWLWGSWPDENTWTFFGPGGRRGFVRVWGGKDGRYFDRQYIRPRRGFMVVLGTNSELLRNHMALLTKLRKDISSRLGKPFSMLDVQHTLCGWDKYRRFFDHVGGRRLKPFTPKQGLPPL